MSEIVANRYAEALFQLAKEKDLSEEFFEECRVVADVFGHNQQLHTFLEHPGVTTDKKEQFLGDVFKGVAPDVLNTIKLLVGRHRTDMVHAVMKAFIQMENEANGIAEANVYSARELSDDEIQKLEENFAKRFGKKEMKLKNIIDPTVIGGVKLRMENTIYDGTIRGKLHRIERDIVSANN